MHSVSLVQTASGGVAFNDVGSFILLALDRPLSPPLSLQVLVVHRLSRLELHQVSCTSAVASPYGLSPSGTPLLCHCCLLLVYWSVCDRWQSGSCQSSKHQLCRTEASVLLRGVSELQQSFLNTSAILQTLVHRVLDSLYSCFSFSIRLIMTWRQHGVNNALLYDHAVELRGVDSVPLVDHAVELSGADSVPLVDHAVELRGMNSAPLVDHAVDNVPLVDHDVDNVPFVDHAVELRGGELRALIRDDFGWNTISGRMDLKLA